MISEIMLLAMITMDGKPSYPSIIPPLLAIAGLSLGVAIGSKRFKSCPKKAKPVFWIILVAIVMAFSYLILFSE